MGRKKVVVDELNRVRLSISLKLDKEFYDELNIFLRSKHLSAATLVYLLIKNELELSKRGIKNVI